MDRDLQAVAGSVAVRVRPELVGELACADWLRTGQQQLQQIQRPTLGFDPAGEFNAVAADLEATERPDAQRASGADRAKLRDEKARPGTTIGDRLCFELEKCGAQRIGLIRFRA